MDFFANYKNYNHKYFNCIEIDFGGRLRISGRHEEIIVVQNGE